MAVEDRVKALETEISILKNQIQSTLVEIQEQILLHYYPALRATASAPAARDNGETARPAISPARAQAAHAPLAEPPSSPSPRRVTLPALPLQQTETTYVGGPAGRADIAWETFAELVAWVGYSVDKIGLERTNQIAAIYARAGYLAPQVKETLFQLVSLADELTPPGRVGVPEILDALTRLNAALGRGLNVAETLGMLEEGSGG